MNELPYAQMGVRKRRIRSLPNNYQEKRRRAALEQQAYRRGLTLDALRGINSYELCRSQEENGELVTSSVTQSTELSSHFNSSELPRVTLEIEPPMIGEISGLLERNFSSKSRRQALWSRQLMIPEWMIEIPPDLGTEWLVMPRPEGDRCLVVAERGRTISRKQNGSILENFVCGLPGGNEQNRSSYKTVLDCIFNAPLKTYYVLDVLLWKGQDMQDCSAEVRLFWCRAQLSEMREDFIGEINDKGCVNPYSNGSMGLEASEISVRTISSLPYYAATPSGLKSSYSNEMPFQRDGLYFIHAKAQYQPGTMTPLALLWKDASSSRYHIDTHPSGAPMEEQQVVLQYRDDGSVATNDVPPVTLGVLPKDFIHSIGENKLYTGLLLRFKLGDQGVAFQPYSDYPVGADLHLLGLANQRRGHADSLSRIVFQWMVRHDPLSFHDLMETAKISGGKPIFQGSSLAVSAATIGVQPQEEPTKPANLSPHHSLMDVDMT